MKIILKSPKTILREFRTIISGVHIEALVLSRIASWSHPRAHILCQANRLSQRWGARDGVPLRPGTPCRPPCPAARGSRGPMAPHRTPLSPYSSPANKKVTKNLTMTTFAWCHMIHPHHPPHPSTNRLSAEYQPNTNRIQTECQHNTNKAPTEYQDAPASPAKKAPRPARRAAGRAGWGATAAGTLFVICLHSVGILLALCWFSRGIQFREFLISKKLFPDTMCKNKEISNA